MNAVKLKFWNKLLLWLGCLLCLALGAALVAAAVCECVVFNVESVFGYVIPDPKWVNLCLIAAGAVLIVFAFYALSIPGKLKYKKRSFVVQTTESGDLRIAVKAIEGLVKRCVDMHEEISLSGMRIYSRKAGVVVELRINLHGNISIPLAVASLQKQIKQYLLASSGIEVYHVTVTVDTTKLDAVKKIAPAAQVEETEAEEEPKKEKKPMHQRIFARNEQQEAKAEVKQEAPAKEEAPAQEEKQETPAEEAPAGEEAAKEAPVAEENPAPEAEAAEEAKEELAHE